MISRYLSVLREDGTIRLMRSDGGDITPEEHAWLKEVMQSDLREKALLASKSTMSRDDLVALAYEGKPVRGRRFDIDPVMFDLEAERKRQRITKKALSLAMFAAPNCVSDSASGQQRAQMDTLRMMAYLLGFAFMLVPKDLQPKIREMVHEWHLAQIPAEEAAGD